MKQPAIRQAEPGDLAGITEIYGHYVNTSIATFEETAPDVSEMSKRFQAVVRPGLPWLVAVDETRVEGYAYAAPWRSRSAYRYAVEDSIYVAQDKTRNGLGRLLLTELIRRCEDLGMRQMVAVIGGSTSIASIELHRRLGFELAGVLPSFGFKFNTWADAVLMTRPLGSGDTTHPSEPVRPSGRKHPA